MIEKSVWAGGKHSRGGCRCGRQTIGTLDSESKWTACRIHEGCFKGIAHLVCGGRIERGAAISYRQQTGICGHRKSALQRNHERVAICEDPLTVHSGYGA